MESSNKNPFAGIFTLFSKGIQDVIKVCTGKKLEGQKGNGRQLTRYNGNPEMYEAIKAAHKETMQLS